MSNEVRVEAVKVCSCCKQVKEITMSIYTAAEEEYHYCRECQAAGDIRLPVELEDEELKQGRG
jgi:hypothetical protein